MNRVDTHIILLKHLWDEKQYEWYDECLESLEDEPTNLHLIEGIDGHTGVGRSIGFSAGDCEYVAFVDPDDKVVSGAYQKAVDFLDENPHIDLCCSREIILNEQNGRVRQPKLNYKTTNYRITRLTHHLVVARRSAMDQYSEFMKNFEFRVEVALWLEMFKNGHGMQLLDHVGYVWRKHPRGAHHIFARSEVNEYLLNTYRQLKQEYYEANGTFDKR